MWWGGGQRGVEEEEEEGEEEGEEEREKNPLALTVVHTDFKDTLIPQFISLTVS